MKKNEPDKLAQEVRQALAAGMSYGKWKALQPRADLSKPAIPADWKPCEYCGEYFKPKQGKRFCGTECRVAAYNAKMKAGGK